MPLSGRKERERKEDVFIVKKVSEREKERESERK
jgi:hypothetical protein